MYSLKLALSLFLASSAASSAANLSSGTLRHENADKKHKRRLDAVDDLSMAQAVTGTTPRRKGDTSTVEGMAKSKEAMEEYASNIKEDETSSIEQKFSSTCGSPDPKGFPFTALDSCAARGKTCEGGHYYKVLHYYDIGVDPDCEDVVRYDAFAENAPEGCVLAPIHSEREYYDVVNAAISLHGYSNMWVGIEKNALDVMNDNSGAGSTDNWYNLDGTPAEICSDQFWYEGCGLDEPQNGHRFLGEQETQAFLFLGAFCYTNRGWLADNTRYPYIGPLDHAIYKCCADAPQFNSCHI